jgi:uncharacterized protein Yka (UPF0111/DUF47 family)
MTESEMFDRKRNKKIKKISKKIKSLYKNIDMIKQLVIEGLYDLYSYDIKFDNGVVTKSYTDCNNRFYHNF